MIPVLVAVYTPDIVRGKRLDIVKEIRRRLKTKQLSAKYILFNPVGRQIRKKIKDGNYKHLLISWTHTMPSWTKTLGVDEIVSGLDTIYLWRVSACDTPESAIERQDIIGNREQKEMKARLIEEERVLIFNDGYFVVNKAPYAMKRVEVKTHRVSPNGDKKKCKRYRLEPGAPEQREVVRLIFDLYGCRNMSKYKVALLLQTQKGNRSGGWLPDGCINGSLRA